MLWTTRIHYLKNWCALCPASRRFLWKISLTRLWTNHSLAWNSNCTHTLYIFVSSCFIYNSFSFIKKYFITVTAMSFSCSYSYKISRVKLSNKNGGGVKGINKRSKLSRCVCMSYQCSYLTGIHVYELSKF